MTLMRHIKSTPAVLKLFFMVMGGVFAISSFSQQVHAQASACDPEFMDALESRAWLEVQREITQNKNIISKPDSVLEYTCFKDFLDVLAGTADTPMFSDNYDGVSHLGQMQSSLQALVGSALNSYLLANFSHPYIDGRGTPPVTDGYVTGGVVQNNFYNCSEMAKVWDTSQCLNFQNEPARDGFYTLDWYVGNDPRTVESCSPSGDTGTFLDEAYNMNAAAYSVNNGSPPADGSPYLKDNVQSFVGLIQPGSCSAPIPTGVTVFRENFTPAQYDDYVCSNPGCYYDPNANACQ